MNDYSNHVNSDILMTLMKMNKPTPPIRSKTAIKLIESSKIKNLNNKSTINNINNDFNSNSNSLLTTYKLSDKNSIKGLTDILSRNYKSNEFGNNNDNVIKELNETKNTINTMNTINLEFNSQDEDKYINNKYLCDKECCSVLGLFEGLGGSAVNSYICDNFITYLKESRYFTDSSFAGKRRCLSNENVFFSLLETHLKLEISLLSEEVNESLNKFLSNSEDKNALKTKDIRNSSIKDSFKRDFNYHNLLYNNSSNKNNNSILKSSNINDITYSQLNNSYNSIEDLTEEELKEIEEIEKIFTSKTKTKESKAIINSKINDNDKLYRINQINLTNNQLSQKSTSTTINNSSNSNKDLINNKMNKNSGDVDATNTNNNVSYCMGSTSNIIIIKENKENKEDKTKINHNHNKNNTTTYTLYLSNLSDNNFIILSLNNKPYYIKHSNDLNNDDANKIKSFGIYYNKSNSFRSFYDQKATCIPSLNMIKINQHCDYLLLVSKVVSKFIVLNDLHDYIIAMFQIFNTRIDFLANSSSKICHNSNYDLINNACFSNKDSKKSFFNVIKNKSCSNNLENEYKSSIISNSLISSSLPIFISLITETIIDSLIDAYSKIISKNIHNTNNLNNINHINNINISNKQINKLTHLLTKSNIDEVLALKQKLDKVFYNNIIRYFRKKNEENKIKNIDHLNLNLDNIHVVLVKMNFSKS